MNYLKAYDILDGPNANASCRKRGSKKLGNNTYLFRRQELGQERPAYAVRLHNTDIIRFCPNGDIRLSSGGYLTVTTKARLNEFLEGWCVYSDRVGIGKDRISHWFVYPRKAYWYDPETQKNEVEVVPKNPNVKDRYYFDDGIILKPDKTVENEGEDVLAKQIKERVERKEGREHRKEEVRRLKLGRGKRLSFPAITHGSRGFESQEITGEELCFTTGPGGEEFRSKGFVDPAVDTHPISLRFVLHRTIGDEERPVAFNKQWSVSVADVGCYVSQAQTRADAIIFARNDLMEMGAERIRENVVEFLGNNLHKFFSALEPELWWDEGGVGFTDSLGDEYPKYLLMHRGGSDTDRWAHELRTIGHVQEYSNGEFVGFHSYRNPSDGSMILSEPSPSPFKTLEAAKEWVEIQVRTRLLFEQRQWK